MAEKITPRETDFSQWYLDVVLNARLADYSPVKGCMVIRPNGYSIWEKIRDSLDRRIRATGTRNAYFPLFIPESFLSREAEHVEGFAPELAVVTQAGGKELEERLVVRPTSETIINSMFSKWIQSYRDLPLKLNQWANVVRWEMRTRLFLRTTEFLWQEGHTCHATPEEAEQMSREILDVYRNFCEETLAMPVYWGLKTDSERFAGAVRTYCIEGMMQDRKALQAGTTHFLGDNFAKAFETKFLDSDGKEKLVHQSSWGVSTRLIGGLVMTHSDDKGLVLPPSVAETHVVIIPIGKKGSPELESVLIASEKLAEAIRSSNASVCVQVDADMTKQAGWKFHEVELIGIPLRIEVGPRDLDKNQAVVARRDTGKKEFLPLEKIPAFVTEALGLMQKNLLDKAKKFRDENTHRAGSYEEFKKLMADNAGFVEGAWCQGKECEEKAKTENKSTIRCLPLDSAWNKIAEKDPCILCGAQKENVRAIMAKSY